MTVHLETLSRRLAVSSCPVESTFAVIGGRWKPVILFHLVRGKLRFSELKRSVPAASVRILARLLKELERDELVNWSVFAEVPFRVGYSLTPPGETLIPVPNAMCDWGSNTGSRHQIKIDGPRLGRTRRTTAPLCVHVPERAPWLVTETHEYWDVTSHSGLLKEWSVRRPQNVCLRRNTCTNAPLRFQSRPRRGNWCKRKAVSMGGTAHRLSRPGQHPSFTCPSIGMGCHVEPAHSADRRVGHSQ